MNTKATAQIVRHINDAVTLILNRIQVNTILFSVSLAITSILALMMIWVFVWINNANTKAAEGKVLAIQANDLAQKNATAIEGLRVKQDQQFAQFTDYIKETINVWNKLQMDNASPKDVQRRGVNVPVAPTLRPSGVAPLTDKELERIIRPAPEPNGTPQVIIKEVPKIKYRTRPTPTPKPFFHFFKDNTR